MLTYKYKILWTQTIYSPYWPGRSYTSLTKSVGITTFSEKNVFCKVVPSTAVRLATLTCAHLMSMTGPRTLHVCNHWWATKLPSTVSSTVNQVYWGQYNLKLLEKNRMKGYVINTIDSYKPFLVFYIFSWKLSLFDFF